MEELLAFVAKYGGSGAIGVVACFLVLSWLKKQPIEIKIGSGNSNGNGNGNGKGTYATYKDLMQHSRECAPEIHAKIEQYNKDVTQKIDAYHHTVVGTFTDHGERIARLEGRS